MKSLFEEMGGKYTLDADETYYPDLELLEEEPHYGKYGRIRLQYLKEHRKALYNTLLLDGDWSNIWMRLMILLIREWSCCPCKCRSVRT